MQVDLLILNGRVLDPARGINEVVPVAVHGRKLVSWQPDMTAKTVIDAAGCLVTPGLIDFHAHIFENGTDSGIDPDLAMLPSGITTVVDAGSSGVSTYKSFLEQLDRRHIRTAFFLHISPTGQLTHEYPESIRPDRWRYDKLDEAIERAGARMLGFKMRISRNVVGDAGKELLQAGLELAQRYEKPLVVHVTDPPFLQGEVAAMLRPGDVFCHVYHGWGHTILGEDGKVDPAIWEARQRGVIFDCCHGTANFAFPVAEAAIAQGFWPDVVSSDMNSVSFCRPPLYNLPMVLSKLLALGMPLTDVLACVTATPARLIHAEGELGTLRPGSCADIAILRLQQRPVQFMDAGGETRNGNQVLVPQATILDGTLVWRGQDLCG